ncbi:hypothetical protein, partial [Catenulispora rubra]|uniref:hypothetical protein n=1 Tax=Catenulispora rubra TaxID=280293 RepID=UPI0018926990
SRGLVEAMGGTLTPEETPGGGMTMVVSLPAAGTTQSAEADVPVEASAEAAAEGSEAAVEASAEASSEASPDPVSDSLSDVSTGAEEPAR